MGLSLDSLVGGVKSLLGSTIGSFAGSMALGAGLLLGGAGMSGCDEEENPEPPKEFVADAGHRTVYLSWRFPDDIEMPGIMVRRKIDDFPADSLDGTLVYEGNGQSHMDNGLTANTLYCYKAFFYSNTDPLTYVLVKAASATPYYETKPPYNAPQVFAGASIVPYGEADNVGHPFITASDWEAFFELRVGVLPKENHNLTIRNDFDSIRNMFSSNGNVSSYLGIMIVMTDEPEPVFRGCPIFVGNTTVPGFSDNYSSNGHWPDGQPDVAAMFTVENGNISSVTQNMLKEFFGSSITSRDYSGLWYDAQDAAINSACDMFNTLGHTNIQSGPTQITNSVTDTSFDSDAYVEWDSGKKLVILFEDPYVSNDEHSAINAMANARNGGCFPQDVLYIDLASNLVQPNLGYSFWNSTSEGNLRYTQLQMVRKMGN